MSGVRPKLEDDLIFLGNGRRPQYCGKWKTTSIFKKMEDDILLLNGGNFNLKKMEDYLDFFANER